MGPTLRNEGCGFRSEAAQVSGMTHGAPGRIRALELYRRLSASEVSSNLLVTAYASDGVRERALSAGVSTEDDLPACVRSAPTSAPSGRR
jgi:hypothetical protein